MVNDHHSDKGDQPDDVSYTNFDAYKLACAANFVCAPPGITINPLLDIIVKTPKDQDLERRRIPLRLWQPWVWYVKQLQSFTKPNPTLIQNRGNQHWWTTFGEISLDFEMRANIRLTRDPRLDPNLTVEVNLVSTMVA